MFSVLILTYNEAERLPHCLEQLRGLSDDIVVLDSGSADTTVALARGAGARVETHPFENFAAQRNHAHERIAFRHPWVLHLDADEWPTPELAAECAAIGGRDPGHIDGYYAAPRMRFQGRWIRRSSDYPAWQARFVHAGRFRFVEAGHGQREAPGLRLERLTGDYWHDITPASTEEWERKHRRYAAKEAAHFLAAFPGLRPCLSRLLGGDPLERRRALKQLSLLLPARPLARFVYQYLLRGGFLDGPQGLLYCRLQSRYEGYIAEELAYQRHSATPKEIRP